MFHVENEIAAENLANFFRPALQLVWGKRVTKCEKAATIVLQILKDVLRLLQTHFEILCVLYLI